MFFFNFNINTLKLSKNTKKYQFNIFFQIIYIFKIHQNVVSNAKINYQFFIIHFETLLQF
jgi:hypothetical protein